MNLLDIMAERGVKGIVFSSSCTVYGEPDVNPVTEQSPIKKATSPYGNTKQISEEIITDVINAGAPFKSVIIATSTPWAHTPLPKSANSPNGVPQNLIPYPPTQTAMGIRKELSVFRQRLQYTRRLLHPRLHRCGRSCQSPRNRRRAYAGRQVGSQD